MRLLVTTFRFPDELCTGDKTTIHHMLKYLALRHEITFLSFASSDLTTKEMEFVAPYCKRVELVRLPKWRSVANCVRGLVSTDPLQVWYFRSRELHQRIAQVIEEERIEVAYGYHLRSAQYLEKIDACPRILDLKPVQSLNLRRMKDHVSNPIRKLVYKAEHRRVHRYEPRLARAMDRCLVISETDRREIDPLEEHDNLRINPHGLDTSFFAPDPASSQQPGTLIFTGNMNYDPNVDAARSFCEQVYPLIQQEFPSVKLRIAGKNPQPAVLALGNEPSITVTGFVDDIRSETRAAEIAIAPMRIAAGLQNKVLESMSVGLPVVMTSIANEGIGAIPERDALVADSPASFAKQVVRLLKNPEERSRISKAARAFIESAWSWESHFENLENWMHELCKQSALDPSSLTRAPKSSEPAAGCCNATS